MSYFTRWPIAKHYPGEHDQQNHAGTDEGGRAPAATIAARLEAEARKKSKYGGGYAEALVNGWRLGVGVQERYNEMTGKVTHVPVWSVNGQRLSRAKALERVRKPQA